MKALPFSLLCLWLSAVVVSASENAGWTQQARQLETRVNRLERGLKQEITSKEDWLAKKDRYRQELAEMLGLHPMPPKTDLKATKTGEFEHDGIIVEKLHYQSMPGLYVTANLYRPKVVEKPAPAILYACGHSSNVRDGISYGNKAGYEHHGVWYAKQGFVCLIIDSVQLGEILGEHQGTFSKGRWWWISRGYTPAGVEAWAGIRGLDYLETRPEVDKKRFGVAGRSGGGAYSWWVAALDERIVCAAPTAGITGLHDHVVQGCVSGHCDCMFMVNTYGWDYDKVAALVAPRALLIVNTDKDPIFPIDGVYDVYQSVRRVYQLLGEEKKLGLQVAEGGHQDLQPLNTGEFHWMTRHLQGAAPMQTIDRAAVKSIPVEQLRVFQDLPADQRNTKIDESFVARAEVPQVPESAAAWEADRNAWMEALRTKVFQGHQPQQQRSATTPRLVQTEVSSEITASLWEFPASSADEGESVSSFWLVHRTSLKPAELDLIVLNVMDDTGWRSFTNTFASTYPKLFPAGIAVTPDAKALESERKMHQNFKWGMIYYSPSGVGARAWKGSEKEITHRKRRFYLLGQTQESQQVMDIQQAVAAIRKVDGLEKSKLWLQASEVQAVNALYASLYLDGITRLDLHRPAVTHQGGDAPAYLNVLKYLDIPQAVALAAERTRVILYSDHAAAWQYPGKVAEKLGWKKENGNGFQLREASKTTP